MYSLMIFQESVMTLSATHRYKRKYVTTVLYKPISASWCSWPGCLVICDNYIVWGWRWNCRFYSSFRSMHLLNYGTLLVLSRWLSRKPIVYFNIQWRVWTIAEAYLELFHTSKIQCFAKIVNSLKPWAIFAKRPILCFTVFWICFWIYFSSSENQTSRIYRKS